MYTEVYQDESQRVPLIMALIRHTYATSARYGRDTRPSCLDQHGDGEYFSDLLCVSPQLPPDILPWLDLWVNPAPATDASLTVLLNAGDTVYQTGEVLKTRVR